MQHRLPATSSPTPPRAEQTPRTGSNRIGDRGPIPLDALAGVSVTSGWTKDRTPSESAQPPTGEVTTRTTVATAGESHGFKPPTSYRRRMSALSNTLERQCRIRRSTLNPRAGSWADCATTWTTSWRDCPQLSHCGPGGSPVWRPRTDRVLGTCCTIGQFGNAICVTCRQGSPPTGCPRWAVASPMSRPPCSW